MQIKDRVVVVTGASSGIGRATALLLASKGAKVWAVARSEDLLRELEGSNPRITAFVADLKDEERRAELVERVGPVDILVNNAGVGWAGRVETMPTHQVRGLLEINIMATIDLCQKVLPAMTERGEGHIVNIASVASFVSIPPLSVYSATKYAVRGFSDGLRRETLGTGVTVGVVHPGPTNTAFAMRAIAGDEGRSPDKSMKGVPATWVARAIARSIRWRYVPGYQIITVPRLAGVIRVAELPGLTRVVDLVGTRVAKAVRSY